MPSKVVLFGAFDRHNFGDLLFPHVVEKLLPGYPIEFAGLADRDLRPWGGHLVRSLTSIDLDEHTTLIHCGGELLTCTAWQAAVMLQSPERAGQDIAQYDADPGAAMRWAAEVLHTRRAIPYVAGQDTGKLIFNAVGGVEWPLLGADQQLEVIAALKQAQWVSARDRVTQAHLQAAVVMASLCPDPAVMVKECFGDVIQQHSQQSEVAEMLRTFSNGYIACQFSAEFGDDETLDQIAESLRKVCAETGFGVVLFRAGAAPWHDQLEPYERLGARMPPGRVRVFRSLHLWDICALIAASRVFCGSSLHGSIIALAYGLPHVSLLATQHNHHPGKVGAFIETWEPSAFHGCVKMKEVEDTLIELLELPTQGQLETTERLIGLYMQSQQQWMSMLD